MKQRERDEVAIRRLGAAVEQRRVQVARGHRIHGHVEMRQFGRLGLTRGARREEHHGRVIRRRRVRRTHGRLPMHQLAQCHGAFHSGGRRGIGRHHHKVCTRIHAIAGLAGHGRHGQFGGAFEDQKCLRIRLLQVECNFARLQQHVERHDDPAHFEDAVIGDGKVRQVWTRERHVVTSLQPQLPKPSGHLAGHGIQLPVGEARRAHHDGLARGREFRLMV